MDDPFGGNSSFKLQSSKSSCFCQHKGAQWPSLAKGEFKVACSCAKFVRFWYGSMLGQPATTNTFDILSKNNCIFHFQDTSIEHPKTNQFKHSETHRITEAATPKPSRNHHSPPPLVSPSDLAEAISFPAVLGYEATLGPETLHLLRLRWHQVTRGGKGGQVWVNSGLYGVGKFHDVRLNSYLSSVNLTA